MPARKDRSDIRWLKRAAIDQQPRQLRIPDDRCKILRRPHHHRCAPCKDTPEAAPGCIARAVLQPIQVPGTIAAADNRSHRHTAPLRSPPKVFPAPRQSAACFHSRCVQRSDPARRPADEISPTAKRRAVHRRRPPAIFIKFAGIIQKFAERSDSPAVAVGLIRQHRFNRLVQLPPRLPKAQAIYRQHTLCITNVMPMRHARQAVGQRSRAPQAAKPLVVSPPRPAHAT